MTDSKPTANFIEKAGTLVDSPLVGEGFSNVQPASDPVLYGHVEIDSKGEFEVRSLQTIKLTYTVGRFGLDDTGAIRVTFRAMSDEGKIQTTNPTAPNYVTAKTSNGVPLKLSFDGRSNTPRPRWKCLTIAVTGGYLSEGDTILITFGDTSKGSPGMQMQTCVEANFEFKVTADVCAVGHFTAIPNTPSITIVSGESFTWKAVLSSLRKPNESFIFGLKAEDIWGNPSDRAEGDFIIETTLPVKNLPESFNYTKGTFAKTFENLSVSETGELRITIRDKKDGKVIAESHPMKIEDGNYSGYWGDLHGQSGESIGLSTSASYFEFAKERAFLDITSHQANCFQINNAFWEHINKLTAFHHEDGRFVTFPGYEWSGNTSVGGDRNVFFRNEGEQIRRSSHALLPERHDVDTDAINANLLFEALADKDCLLYAHVGGRYADIKYAHDPKLEVSMEIHSAWGTFEWLLTDGFKLGYRNGVVCNSDGHKGRPGASYPGASTFGAYGGLTCFYAEELTRDGIFDSLRKRHHYGTTGTRMHLTVNASFENSANLFDLDPKAFDTAKSTQVKEVMMGDIVQTNDSNATIKVSVSTQSPIERIEIRNGFELLKTVRPYAKKELGDRIRVIWSGAEYRGRGRETQWKGKAQFEGATIKNLQKINAFNHERLFKKVGSNTVVFDAITTGNYGGFDAWIDSEEKGRLSISTNQGSIDVDLKDIGYEDIVLDAGGLERKLKVFRLPESNPYKSLDTEIEVDLKQTGDNPLWVCVFTEDGFQAWSSPIYVYK